MRALSSALRKQLETSVQAARRAAESASRATIDGLGVFVDRRPEHLNTDQSILRNGLRAKWRQLGGDRELLIAECAYEQWHRLLFARFLAENGLLLHPKYKAPVTLVDCEELASELGEPDAWSVAAQFAAEILPGIFRLDDPCVRLRLAPEGRYALEQILDTLPADIFAADDALGWVYQFWQTDKKDEVNASERKIGGADLGPVTQLFTENYMVRFLLENSLGAWWVARHSDSPLVKDFDYLRLDDDTRPAAGSFDSWPDHVADVTVMDPCCGSGHFLVEAFSMLWQMRSEEEGLAPVDAQDAVLRDNLFGLELDPRCVQIATFAVALQAWKAGGGWRQLPVPNIACSGIPVKAPVDEWTALARGDQRLGNALARLHALFQNAEVLGSLINPRLMAEAASVGQSQITLEEARWDEVEPLLESASQLEAADPATAVLGANAAAIARAAELLSRRYNLIATNVPYLGSARQDALLKQHLETYHRAAKWDLATAFVSRSWELTAKGGTQAVVTPTAWCSQSSYRVFREELLERRRLGIIARLGPGAFTAISGEVVQPVLAVLTSAGREEFQVVDASRGRTPSDKARSLQTVRFITHDHGRVRSVPEARIPFAAISEHPLLNEFADSYWGIGTGDGVRFGRFFWELAEIGDGWVRFQGGFNATRPFAGRSRVLLWEDGDGALRELAEVLRDRLKNIWRRGQEGWGKRGVAVNRSGRIYATLYTGEIFESLVATIVPRDPDLLPAVWAFCASDEFASHVRAIDAGFGVTNLTLVKVPFDVDRWRQVAEEAGPLPDPYSDDPTQWLFNGRPETTVAPLQVAVGRLLGYRWPEQAGSDDLDGFVDADGIVCLPSVAGEAPAADRVQQVLAAAFGAGWSPAMVKELLEQAGSKKKNLADWLRDEFFKQHCALFGSRPFVWHIWDGQLDGFSALVNYHRLDRKTLEKLTYTYLGQDWVERQRADVRDEVAGAATRLSAALSLQRKLEAILEGEAPYDIYVRWKDAQEQPIGWEPDLDDGIRLNVRPFVEAGVLRAPFTIHWRKDRGKNPDGSERENDKHLTLATKLDAGRHEERS